MASSRFGGGGTVGMPPKQYVDWNDSAGHRQPVLTCLRTAPRVEGLPSAGPEDIRLNLSRLHECLGKVATGEVLEPRLHGGRERAWIWLKLKRIKHNELGTGVAEHNLEIHGPIVALLAAVINP